MPALFSFVLIVSVFDNRLLTGRQFPTIAARSNRMRRQHKRLFFREIRLGSKT
jgi:hypothetical protein